MFKLTSKWVLSVTLLISLEVTVYVFPQTELLASCASDRSIVLYDMRESAPLKKVQYHSAAAGIYLSLSPFLHNDTISVIYLLCVFICRLL